MEVLIAQVEANGVTTEGPGDEERGATTDKGVKDDAWPWWSSITGTGGTPADGVRRDRAFAYAYGREGGTGIMRLPALEAAAIILWWGVSGLSFYLPDMGRLTRRAAPVLTRAGQDTSTSQRWGDGPVGPSGNGGSGEGPHIAGVAP